MKKLEKKASPCKTPHSIWNSWISLWSPTKTFEFWYMLLIILMYLKYILHSASILKVFGWMIVCAFSWPTKIRIKGDLYSTCFSIKILLSYKWSFVAYYELHHSCSLNWKLIKSIVVLNVSLIIFIKSVRAIWFIVLQLYSISLFVNKYDGCFIQLDKYGTVFIMPFPSIVIVKCTGHYFLFPLSTYLFHTR